MAAISKNKQTIIIILQISYITLTWWEKSIKKMQTASSLLQVWLRTF